MHKHDIFVESDMRKSLLVRILNLSLKTLYQVLPSNALKSSDVLWYHDTYGMMHQWRSEGVFLVFWKTPLKMSLKNLLKIIYVAI